ncbi:PIG-L deacetylase family protein [Paeniglutamicibacter cryotolerans]|uniref:LmbE family N-acetylglucosaminyl deacetylase n=1 Tax=Paeniglutamicibacter cryotolerans TaxID=670079 RepID=A0A839QF76_9MICC|nr:PIG-L deacetylase family protein [Paeniglutamicibacter cryotolerans]MBB2994560.1 LmbE family N-acetylglucosaminyl deacetylase [Paeniglutamicibacter cryotolerans]
MLPYLNDSEIQRVLCVVAHPDDMEYGASAAVAEWRSRGIEVGYLLLTSGEAGIRGMDPRTVGPLRAEEQRRACEIVGVSDLTILDLPDGLLEADLEVRAHITHQIRRFKPDAVLTMTWELEVPWGLNHADHRAAGLGVIDAIRDADNPWLFRPDEAESDPGAWAVSWLLVTGTENTHAIPVSEKSLEMGIASLNAHEVYLSALPDHVSARELLTGLLTNTGREAGVEYALGVRVLPMG